MTEMGIATRAADFGTAREPRTVLMLGDRLRVDRRIEARPAGTGIVFGRAREQRRAATYASIVAGALLVPIGSGEGALGAVLTRHAILLGCQLGAPLGIGLHHRGASVGSGHGFPLLGFSWGLLAEDLGVQPLRDKSRLAQRRVMTAERMRVSFRNCPRGRDPQGLGAGLAHRRRADRRQGIVQAIREPRRWECGKPDLEQPPIIL